MQYIFQGLAPEHAEVTLFLTAKRPFSSGVIPIHYCASRMTLSCILAVMGVTGAGKSSFVKLVTGDSSINIGHSYLQIR